MELLLKRGCKTLARDNFLRGAFILTVAGMLVKVIGSVNRILISRFLGGEGIGLYQMAYPIFLLISSISSAGIPVAISIVVSERLALNDRFGAQRAFKISLLITIATGLLFSLLLYFGAGWLIDNQIVRDKRAYYALIALTPAVFFSTVLASFRGYFQGFQRMIPTAVSQIVEQFVRVVTMVAFAYFLLSYGLEYAAAGASFGAVPGTLAGFLVLIGFYWHQKKNEKKEGISNVITGEKITAKNLISRLVSLALPVSVANIMVPMVSSIDALVVPVRLEAAGYSVEQATTLFGYLTGMALPLVMMATIPTNSLALSLVPSISEAYALKDHESLKRRMTTAMRLVGIITVPCFIGMAVIAEPISKLLYGTPNAGESIMIMSLGIFFLGIHQVTTAVLQGISKASIPMINMVVSALVKVVIAWVLTANPAWGIAGAAWASNIDFALAAVLNLIFLYKYTGFLFAFKATFKIYLAALPMALCAIGAYSFIFNHLNSNSIATLVAICLSGIVYFVMLPCLGCVTKDEVSKIPVVGKKIAPLMKG